jgi:UDP-2,3-diacylglucosamine pyrophosphatase LpxH
MIIRPMSDLHLEFDGMYPWVMPRIEGEKDMVLVLAGDITANHNQWKDNPSLDVFSPWIKDVCARHKAVIYVSGNHENYIGDMYAVEDHWRAMSKHIENLHFLNRQSVVIDGVRILGCTLWTDLSNPINEMIAYKGMNDFGYIWVDGDLFTRAELAINHSHVSNYAAVGVVNRIEDHCPSWGIGVALGSWNLADDYIEQFCDADTSFP